MMQGKEQSRDAAENFNYNSVPTEKEPSIERTVEETEQHLKLTIAQSRLAIMERVKEATERGDLEAVSRWLNVLSMMRNLLGKVAD